MTDKGKNYRKIIYLSFPYHISKQPLVCDLARKFDLSFNILKAHITPRQDGFMTLEVTASSQENFEQGIIFLKDQGVKVTSVAQKIARDEDSCMHCGVCTALCPTLALELESESRKILFDAEKCSACGLCVKICPVHAMEVDLDNGALS